LGEQWYNGSATKWLFTSYERDSESANDFAVFRYHVVRFGRFNAPDPLAGSLAVPQSLNRYAYVLNDVVNSVDPLGLQQRKIEPFMQPDTDRRTCVVDGIEQSCASVSFSAVWLWRPGLIAKDGQIYQSVRVPVRKRGVDVTVNGVANPGTDYYEWEIQLRLVKTNEWIDFGWYRTFFREVVSWENFGRAQQEAWDKGYYSCLGEEMLSSGNFLSPVAGKVIEEAAVKTVEHSRLPEVAAGAYYHFTDGRFTAWGRSSQVLVPNAAANIRAVARGASVVGWAYFNYEMAHAIGTCSTRLK
jgi:RHS repeat-associated protein